MIHEAMLTAIALTYSNNNAFLIHTHIAYDNIFRNTIVTWSTLSKIGEINCFFKSLMILLQCFEAGQIISNIIWYC